MKRNGAQVSEDDLAAGWIERMAQGDSNSLAALYRLYHRPLLTIFMGMLRQRESAEEVLQDTFVKAFQKASSFDPEKGSAFAWLVTIGRRLSIDRIRRNRARSDNEILEHSGNFADNSLSSTGESVRRQTELSWINEIMKTLSDDQRTVIQMAFLDGLTHYEIAELTGQPLGTVKSHIYRGLNALRNEYFGNND